jgi:phage terminase large subunit-like protein
MKPDLRTLIRFLATLSPEGQATVVAGLPEAVRRAVIEAWDVWALEGQLPPLGDWRVWLIRAGRGFGKTRAGAEWVHDYVRRVPEARIALVGATLAEVQRVMVQGPSGVIAVARDDEPLRWSATKGEVRWPSGAVATVYSSEAPESLRGPEHHLAWCDELAKWRYGEETWDNLQLTMRLGDGPRVLVTTTPRATTLMKRVMTLPDGVETRGNTRDNPYVPGSFVAAMVAEYGGKRLGRQELDGELIEDVAGALWSRALLERQRVREAPAAVRVVVGVDPPAGIGGDACGIVAVAKGADGHAYVLEDASVANASPEGWARAVAGCAGRHAADRVVAEGNQGGEMVRSVLRSAQATLPVRIVHARHGKVTRAEPVVALYETGRAWHVGAFAALEDELCGLVKGGRYEGPGRSPDRADACVWAMTELMLEASVRAAVRTL